MSSFIHKLEYPFAYNDTSTLVAIELRRPKRKDMPTRSAAQSEEQYLDSMLINIGTVMLEPQVDGMLPLDNKVIANLDLSDYEALALGVGDFSKKK